LEGSKNNAAALITSITSIIGRISDHAIVHDISYVNTHVNPADGFSRGETTYDPQLVVDIHNRINWQGRNK
jgi:hypothetical protein